MLPKSSSSSIVGELSFGVSSKFVSFSVSTDASFGSSAKTTWTSSSFPLLKSVRVTVSPILWLFLSLFNSGTEDTSLPSMQP